MSKRSKKHAKFLKHRPMPEPAPIPEPVPEPEPEPTPEPEPETRRAKPWYMYDNGSN